MRFSADTLALARNINNHSTERHSDERRYNAYHNEPDLHTSFCDQSGFDPRIILFNLRAYILGGFGCIIGSIGINAQRIFGAEGVEQIGVSFKFGNGKGYSVSLNGQFIERDRVGRFTLMFSQLDGRVGVRGCGCVVAWLLVCEFAVIS